MRGDFIGGQSSTGGTGALTLTAASGLALPALAFVAGQTIEYSIVEYADATLTAVVRAESGFGYISAGNVLTRTMPRTTWNGTTYDNTSPAALSFGTTNVRAYVSPIAAGGPDVMPALWDTSADSNGVYGWSTNAANADFSDYGGGTVDGGRVYLQGYKHAYSHPVTQVAVDVMTAGAAGTLVNVALATIHPDTGRADKVVLAVNGFDAASTGLKSQTITAKFIPPGWYYALITANATCVLRGHTQTLFNPMGALASGSRHLRYTYRSRTFANFVEGAAGEDGMTLSWSNVVNLSAPSIFMR